MSIEIMARCISCGGLRSVFDPATLAGTAVRMACHSRCSVNADYGVVNVHTRHIVLSKFECAVLARAKEKKNGTE